MSVEITTTKVTEMLVTYERGTIALYPWGSCDGVAFVMEDKEGTELLSANLRWEDVSALVTALSAVQV